jgi:hypothetical protein
MDVTVPALSPEDPAGAGRDERLGQSRYFDHPDPVERFMAWESVNVYPRASAGSTLDPKYRPALGREFTVKVLEIPVGDLHVADSGEPSARARQAIYSEEGAFRFAIHPESERLYADLIAKYGVARESRVTPTASGRTVLMREERVFAKLTVDRIQDELGRAVPEWEVRRAVAISRLCASLPKTEMRKHGVALIPEIAGAYIRLDEDAPAPSYIDRAQGAVFQHGMIYRPADFLDEYPGKEVLPAFSLLSSRGDAPPLVVTWWRDAESLTGVSFAEFIDATVIAPVVRALAWLVFSQGLLPDAHLQNMVFVVDPKTRCVETVLFRDLGGVKVNLELRWSRNLPVETMRGAGAAYDFKFEWGAEMSRRPFYQWFNRYAFSFEYGYGLSLQKHVPGYGPMAMTRLIDSRVRGALEEHFPEAAASGPRTVRACLERHLDLHPPELGPARFGDDAARLDAFVERQRRFGQVLSLRHAWLANETPLATEYGVVHRGPAGPQLALSSPHGLSIDGPEPGHFQTDATGKEILGAGTARRGASAGARSGLEGTSAEARRPIRALRIGTLECPRYYVAEDDLREIVRALGSGARTIRLEVVHNWSGFKSAVQRRLIRCFLEEVRRARSG